ncbi:MAG TPA: glycine cleavage system protein GcvH [bacterium]|nr:glycine cleavage system protein GcvH [bacterium]
MHFPDDLKYTEEHEWAKYDESQGIITIGITGFAQSELGDIVFLELPDIGSEAQAGEPLGTIEAVKTVADLYSPVTGTVSDVNEALDDAPELINDDPYGKGWILKIEVSDPQELEGLLSAEKYKTLTE